MRIGDVAARAGVSVRALRYYEEQGLLAPTRSVSGQRHYAEAAVERVQLIQQLYAAGISSARIRDLLPCIHAGVSTPDSLALLAAERARIDEQIIGLIETRDRLDSVIAAAERAVAPQLSRPPAPQADRVEVG
ncbi:MerR family transcriptional regulator [Phytohabitans houttuyneae]|uniref:MerR family transcriptional regulator n=1 Tax=Phytohabitans houttuyneae TaxID=1076126 RepID=A0A6V8KK52_9ACTN|nr:MerR family transcriptional regulator [Phytohabitans houttuyneae]GFJ83790.1 MerR family transcriptional regulator [Phytohabitans houttuyneae]